MFVTFKELLEKSVLLKIATQAFEAGGFLNIFLRFWAFWGSFSYQNFCYKRNVYPGLLNKIEAHKSLKFRNTFLE